VQDKPLLFGQVIRQLRAEGLPVTPAKIAYAVYTGHIDTVPTDAAGNRLYSTTHVAQLREYLKSPPKTGRKSASPEATQ
jgi:hypothetical protein